MYSLTQLFLSVLPQLSPVSAPTPLSGPRIYPSALSSQLSSTMFIPTLHPAQTQFLPSAQDNPLPCSASPMSCYYSVLPIRVTLRNSLCPSNLIKSTQNQVTRVHNTRPCLDPWEPISSCPTSLMDLGWYAHKFRDSCLLSEPD